MVPQIQLLWRYRNFNIRSIQNSKTEDIHTMELRFKVPGIPDNTIYFYWHTDAADYMGKNMVVIALKEKVRDIHMIRKSSSPKAVYWINNNEVKAIEELTKYRNEIHTHDERTVK